MSTEIHTKRLYLRELTPDDAEMFCEFLLKNRDHFEDSGPAYNEEYLDVKFHRKQLERSAVESADGRHYKFGIFRKEKSSTIIGTVALSNIMMGNFCSCFLGYRIDKDECSKGFATEALEQVISFAFGTLNLHRIEANIIPGNIASICVAEKLGFVYEGASEKYLLLNGQWQKHLHYALINYNWERD